MAAVCRATHLCPDTRNNIYVQVMAERQSSSGSAECISDRQAKAWVKTYLVVFPVLPMPVCVEHPRQHGVGILHDVN